MGERDPLVVMKSTEKYLDFGAGTKGTSLRS